jgi:uncharacterized protein
MLPEFPQFKKLELGDKKEIEKITGEYPPYSDFNFVSMWSWDVKGEMRISVLHGNLVVQFTDYITGRPFYSFLGNSKVGETASTLLELSRKDGFEPKLKLLPEDSIMGIDVKKFNVQENRDHFDYVYDFTELSSLVGGKFAHKRNQVSAFLKKYPEAQIKIIDLKDKDLQTEMINLHLKWSKKKAEKEQAFESHDEAMFERLLLTLESCSLVGTGVFVGDKLVAFLISELTPSEYVIAHSSKIDDAFIGVNAFLMKKNSEIMYSLNKRFFNYEQDLGIENLRQAKVRFRPTSFLKKYQLTYY